MRQIALQRVRRHPNRALFDLPVLAVDGGEPAIADQAGPVEQPYTDFASTGVAPQDVGLAVAVEVADAGNLPVRVADGGERARADHAGPVEQPDKDFAIAGVAPQDVGLAVAVEVA